MIGGSDEELAAVAVAIGLLVDRLAACRRRHPTVEDIRRQSAAWRCLDGTSTPLELDLGEGGGVMALLWTRDEVARHLRLSERQVMRLVADGRLRAVHEGRATRFRPADVEAYVEGLPSRGPEQEEPNRE